MNRVVTTAYIGLGSNVGNRVRNLERDGLAGLRRVSEQVEAYVAC